jgi:hypothetical protein
MASLGPMLGQNHHFVQYAAEKIPYAIERYVNETARLYAVLNKQLSGKEFITGTYSIADMAAYPWIVPSERQLQNLDNFPHVKRWFPVGRVGVPQDIASMVLYLLSDQAGFITGANFIVDGGMTRKIIYV